MALKVREVAQNKDITLIDLEGRLDYHLVSEIEKEMIALVDKSNYRIILNLARVDYMSSDGLRLFLNILKKVKDNKGELKLVKLQKGVMKILEVVELTDLFEIFDEEDEAVKNFNTGGKVE